MTSEFEQLDGEQQAAVVEFAQRFRAAAPQMAGAAKAAQRIFDDLKNTPTWRIAETEKPQDVPDVSMWSVGHAKVNYVDKIGTQYDQS